MSAIYRGSLAECLGISDPQNPMTSSQCTLSTDINSSYGPVDVLQPGSTYLPAVAQDAVESRVAGFGEGLLRVYLLAAPWHWPRRGALMV